MTTRSLAAWFAGRLPDDWFTGPVEVRADREEILVTGELATPRVADEVDDPDGQPVDGEAGPSPLDLACAERIAAFRDDTRARRMRVAADAEARFGRKVSWAVRCGPVEQAFTTASVPVMTRLRMNERAVLDTLIDAGVARSRSEALAWCVRLVGRNEQEWIAELRSALAAVHEARAAGPAAG